jgi:hypothetical protein
MFTYFVSHRARLNNASVYGQKHTIVSPSVANRALDVTSGTSHANGVLSSLALHSLVIRPLREGIFMIKKIGLVAAVAAAGMVLFGGMASATTWTGPSSDGGHHSVGDNGLNGQVGLVNLNNLDLLHNVNIPVGVCRNNVNVLGIQATLDHIADGLNIPILSPGQNAATGGSESCAAGAINDGGTDQRN